MSKINRIECLQQIKTQGGSARFEGLLERGPTEDGDPIWEAAQQTAKKYYQNKVFARGLIEISNYCKNDCFYCGIRKSNQQIKRYRISSGAILECCHLGNRLGFQTFVLQGGEDLGRSDREILALIDQIKTTFPDAALTLSLGEKSRSFLKSAKDAGADRYLLRQESCSEALYQKLHPKEMSMANRLECLYQLREMGYVVGTGFMVGAPFQTMQDISKDLDFIERFQPEMIGIGPFIPHHETPFRNHPGGSLEWTLTLIAICRLLCPKALIPATTALASIHPNGREKGILAGANVVMPNLSPVKDRKNYEIYDHKLSTGAESKEGLLELKASFEKIGYQLSMERGDPVQQEPSSSCKI